MSNVDYEALEDLARKCTESKLAELKDIGALDIVEIGDADLADAEIDTVATYCGKFADALQEALSKVSVR